MSAFSWICPFCSHAAFLREHDHWETTGYIIHPLTNKGFQYELSVIFCPSGSCKKIQVRFALVTARQVGGTYEIHRDLREWSLLPESAAKAFPEYIPEAILADYNEACLTATLSPKASATLARRCLQGMIRDFWKISKRRLKDEIDALEDKVDPQTWDAIDSVRKIGNIGAHMEADINVIVDVEPDEATLLINLIETLLADWYIARHNRQQRMSKIAALSEQKQRERDGSSAAPSESTAPATTS